ncbi:MAG: hypothetical protein ACM3PT_10725 [Deltaproteobacteria bacterium]
MLFKAFFVAIIKSREDKNIKPRPNIDSIMSLPISENKYMDVNPIMQIIVNKNK